MKPRFRSLTALSVLTISFAAATASHGQSTWNGTTTAWSLASNWTPAAVPAAGADIVVAATTANGMALDGGTARSINSLTYGPTGTRIGQFTVNTLDTTLTLGGGGIVANGDFIVAATALTMRGNFVIPSAQTWSVGGAVGPGNDHGLFFRDVSATPASAGKVTLNANVTKTGTGQLVMAGTELTGNGNLIVNEGNLKANAGVSLPLTMSGPGNITMNGTSLLSFHKNSGTFNITRPVIMNGTSSFWTRTAEVQVAAPVAWNGTHALSIEHTTALIQATLSGAWTGAGTVNRAGVNPLNLTGNLSGFTGALNLNAGTTTIGSAFGGSLTLASGATLNGEVTTAGALTLNGGTISASATSPASLGTSGALTLSGTVSVALTTAPASTAPFPVLTYGTLASGGVGNLTLAGGAANYRSPVFSTAPGAITLSLGSEARTWNGGGAWDINTSMNWTGGDQKFYQLDSVTFGNTGAGTVAITGEVMPSTITVNSTSDYEFTAAAGNLIGGSGTLVKSGSGILTLGGANTFGGSITVNAGVLKPTHNSALGANGKTVTIASGATLDTNGALDTARDYSAVIAGTGVDGSGVIVNNSATNNINGFGSIRLTADATIGGLARWDLRPVSAGTGVLNLAGFTLTKEGPNIVGIIDSNATAAGSIVVNNGTLSVTRSNVSGTGSVRVNIGSIIHFENNTTGSFSKSLVLDSGLVRTSGNAFTLAGPVETIDFPEIQTETALTLSGGLTGSGVLYKTGAGALILNSAATHTGSTEVVLGSLQIGAGGTTGSIAGDILNNGNVAFDRSDAVTFANVISGTGSFTKQGAGTLTLTNTQAYGGVTTVNGGTLRLSGADNRLPETTSLTFANVAGTRLELNGTNQQVRGLTGGGTTGGEISNTVGGVRTLTLLPADAESPTFSGRILDDIRLVVKGTKSTPATVAPRQRLAGTAHTYNGGTVIDGATLLVRLDGSFGAIPASFDADNIILQNNGLFFNEAEGVVLETHANRGITLGAGGGAISGGFNNNVIIHGVISGPAANPLTITPNNAAVVLDAQNTYQGDTILLPNSGANISRLIIGNGGTTGSHGSGNVINDGRLIYNRTDTYTESATISGTGAVRQGGTGNLVLTAVNTYSGNTEVPAGTFTLADNAGMKFVVTDAASTTVNGAGTAVFEGDFTIDTTAVTVTTGNWTLVHAETLTETFGTSFTVVGWTKAGTNWTKTEGTKSWSFSQGTGVLTLTEGGGGNTYASWIGGFNFSAFPGADLSPNGDADGDGIRNVVEFVIGNAPNLTKVENLPTIALATNPAGVPAGDYLVFSYRRSTASTAAGVGSGAQYDADLVGPWANAVNGSAGVVVIETANASIPGHDVKVHIPRGLAGGGKLFGRLSVLVP